MKSKKKIIWEFIELKSKLYSLVISNNEKNKKVSIKIMLKT